MVPSRGAQREGGRVMAQADEGVSERIGPLRRVALPGSVPGALWLSAMPGRSEPLEAWTAAARVAGVAHLVVLTGQAETQARSPAYAAALAAEALPLAVHRHPIGDFATPDDPAGFAALVARMAGLIGAGEAVAVHCAAGIGRTGMTAQRILVALGLPSGEAADRVAAAGSAPETAAQQSVGRGG